VGEREPMSKHPDDEQVIIDYLLAALPVAEVERLDDLSVTDDEFAQRLRVAENDLVDAYANGELTGDRLERFQSHYLASPRRIEKAQFAQALLTYVDKAATLRATYASSVAPSSSGSRRQRRWLNFFAAPRPILQWGFAAAALLMLLAGGYLLFENQHLRNQMTQAQLDRAALEQRESELQRQLDDKRSADAETEKELERVRERLAEFEQRATNEQRAANELAQPASKVVAFTLAPPMRGGGQTPTVAVPVGTDVVALTLQLESDEFPAYRAALKDSVTDQIIWRSERLKSQSKGGIKILAIRLRADLLKPQHYTLEVSGVRTTGAAEIIGGYSFTAVKQ
jgi:hypothetical protein